MKTKLIPMLLMFIVAAGINAGCNDQQPASPTQPIPNTPQMPAAQMSVPNNPTTPVVWPPPIKGAAADNETIVVAPEDMMASNWAIVLDNSGSMKTRECSGQDIRMVAGGKAVIDFSHKRPAGDNFALILFIGDRPYARVVMSLGRDRALFQKEVQNARPDFNTPLGPAIEVAYGEIVKQGRRQGGYGSYHIVVVTDGDWNQGSDPGPIVKRIVNESPVQVHTVGFCTGQGHRLNISGYTSYVSADNADQINRGLQAVLDAESEVFMDSQFGK